MTASLTLFNAYLLFLILDLVAWLVYAKRDANYPLWFICLPGTGYWLAYKNAAQ